MSPLEPGVNRKPQALPDYLLERSFIIFINDHGQFFLWISAVNGDCLSKVPGTQLFCNDPDALFPVENIIVQSADFAELRDGADLGKLILPFLQKF